MSRLLITTDWHVDAGAHLGVPDPLLGSTRLPENRATIARLIQVAYEQGARGHLILGDVFRTPTPGPAALREVGSLTGLLMPSLVLMGNHDWLPGPVAPDIVSDGAHRTPFLTEFIDGIQVGMLPWQPIGEILRGHEDIRGLSATERHALAARSLVQDAADLAERLDPSRPSVLAVHWFLSGTKLPTGTPVIECREPVLDTLALEAQGWGLITAGHNHRRQSAGERSWVVGPPCRTGYGEAGVPVGGLLADLGAAVPDVRFIESEDRPMLCLTATSLDEARALCAADVPPRAIVRLRMEVPEPDALQAQQIMDAITGDLDRDGVLVESAAVRATRSVRTRSDVTLDSTPESALARWLGQQQLADGQGDRLATLATTIMQGSTS
jgi:hypothetical protein